MFERFQKIGQGKTKPHASDQNKIDDRESIQQEAVLTVRDEIFNQLLAHGVINSKTISSAPVPKKQADILDCLLHMGVAHRDIATAFVEYLRIVKYDEDKHGQPTVIGKDWIISSGIAFLVNPLGPSINDLMEGRIKNDLGEPIRASQFGALALDTFEDLASGGDIQLVSSTEKKDDTLIFEADSLLREIMDDAITRRCSDIHIEPGEDEGAIRMRVNGHLLTTMALPMGESYSALANVLLTKSHNDPGAFNSPKDGQYQWDLHNRSISVRLNMVPIKVAGRYLAKFTLRLLGLELSLSELSRLRLCDMHVEQFKAICRRPNGLVLVTGPTGSGKTTTLYSIMRHIYKLHPDKAFYTLEDPVEIPIAGFNQIEVNPAANMSFAAGLRALLRADPDVIMVGEIRDGETAELAVRASLTGHLVLSTLHSNFAMGAIPRLIDMGIDRGLLADGLLAVSAQRMVAAVCSSCALKVPLEEMETSLGAFALLRNRPMPNDILRVANPDGCSRQGCKGGYSGRRIVNEIVIVNRQLAAMVAKGASMEELNRFQDRAEMNNLWEDGIRLVKEGETTLDAIEDLLGPPPDELEMKSSTYA